MHWLKSTPFGSVYGGGSAQQNVTRPGNYGVTVTSPSLNCGWSAQVDARPTIGCYDQCKNGATCVELGGASFRCVCESGYVGTFCEHDIKNGMRYVVNCFCVFVWFISSRDQRVVNRLLSPTANHCGCAVCCAGVLLLCCAVVLDVYNHNYRYRYTIQNVRPFRVRMVLPVTISTEASHARVFLDTVVHCVRPKSMNVHRIRVRTVVHASMD